MNKLSQLRFGEISFACSKALINYTWKITKATSVIAASFTKGALYTIYNILTYDLKEIQKKKVKQQKLKSNYFEH